jgi:predicted transcriptional regulator
VPFLQPLLGALFTVRVKHAGIYRADIYTLGRLKVADTLGTFIRVDYVGYFPLRDSIVLALGFTRSTTYTVISNFIRHLSALLYHFGTLDYYVTLPLFGGLSSTAFEISVII